jgi:plasmid stability protein
MSSNPEKIIILFHSTHDAITAERACLKSGISCQAVPVPRDLAADCGIALEIDSQEAAAVAAVLDKERISAIFNARQSNRTAH